MTSLMELRKVTPDDVRKLNVNGSIDSIVPSSVSLVEMTELDNKVLIKRNVSPEQILVFDHVVNAKIFEIGLRVLRVLMP